MDLPMGFGMALCSNPKAAKYFNALSGSEQKKILEKTHDIKSSEEMKVFVSHLGNNTDSEIASIE